MPRLDGLSLIRLLRERGVEIPVVILSAFGNKDQAVEALRWGAFDFQDKPYRRDKLLKTVFAAVNIGKKIRKLEFQVDDLLTSAASTDRLDPKKCEELRSLILNKVELDFRFPDVKKTL
jgi:FixJ family two-component response regulator